MKGSPIFSTIVAIAIMACFFAGFMKSNQPPSLPEDKTPKDSDTNYAGANHIAQSELVSCYLDAHFSTPPNKLKIYHALSDTILLDLNSINDLEINKEVALPLANSARSIDLTVEASWNQNTDNIQHFILITLAPDQKENASATLRSNENLSAVATFSWNH